MVAPHLSAVEYAEESDIPGDAIVVVPDRLFVAKDVHCYPLEAGGPGFRFPIGVVPAFDEGDVETDDIREGYASGKEDSTFWVEAVVEAGRIEKTFLSLVRALPSADVLGAIVKSR